MITYIVFVANILIQLFLARVYNIRKIEKIKMQSDHDSIENLGPNQFKIQKTIYPKIRLAQNIKRQFLSSDLIPDKYKTIRVTDPRIQFYFAAVKKLIGNSYAIDLRDVWVCEKNITVFPILIFFTGSYVIHAEPFLYPIMDCCQKCVYIEFDTELSGSVRCSECKACAFSFVRLKQNSHSFYKKSGKQNKENNFVQESQPQAQKQNQRLFKEYKDFDENRKMSVRKLISSNQHRHVSLKKMMGLTDSLQRKTPLITQVNDNEKQTSKKQKKNKKTEVLIEDNETWKQNKIKSRHREEKNIQFIIEIQEKGINNCWMQQLDKDENQTKCRKFELSHHSTELSQTCQQIKTIIQQIFI